ncbi:hypothetical protein ACO2JO_14600 [Leptospira interrogans]
MEQALQPKWRIFEAMFDDPGFEYLIVDSTIVRPHQHASGVKKRDDQARDQAICRSRGGLSTRNIWPYEVWVPGADHA